MKCNPCRIADLLPKRRNAQNLTPLYGFGAILGVFFRYERLCFGGGILTARHSQVAVCRFRVTKKRRIATTLLSCSEVILLLWQYQSFAQSLDFACSLYPNSAPIFSLKSGQPFQLVLQSLLLVLGCGQLPLRNILFASQLFQFFAHGQLLLSDNGQNKSDQLFTVDRLWLGQYFLLLLIIRCLIVCVLLRYIISFCMQEG